jgi:ppGpp synthetase/RelA/SpoT-type nucleotidyltranferase
MLLPQILADESIDVAQLEGRTKSIESFTNKIVRKGEKYDNPLTDIKDLVGLRVILYYPADVEAVGSVIEREFTVDWDHSVRQGADVDPDRFGYRSDHYVVQLGAQRHSLAEWKPFADDCVEIQVRTVMQHAWAAVDHKIRYKGPDLPAQLQRRLARLSALLEVADEQFASLQSASDEVSGSYRASVEAGELDVGLDALSLAAYLEDSQLREKWGKKAVEAGFMPPTPDMGDGRIDALLATLQRCGPQTLHDVDQFFKQADATGERVLALVTAETKNAAAQLGGTGKIWAVPDDALTIVAAVLLHDPTPEAVRWRDDILQGIRAAQADYPE